VLENMTKILILAEDDLGIKFNRELMYTAVLYHDSGRTVNKKYHHIESSKIVRNEEYLKKYFTEDEINLISQMCIEHRSSVGECTTIESALLNDADSINTLERVIERTIQYHLKHDDDKSYNAIYTEVRKHLIDKFGKNGYQKYKTKYANEMVDIEERYEIIENEDKFIKLYNTVIERISY
jgi:uncharacterized protein